MSSVGAVTEDKDQDADDTAQAVCVATGMLLTAVTLVVPTRPMVILGIKGPGESAARIMGLMSASGAAVELLVNPVFGKVCDHYGR
ncbi:unnamed protein product [Effrenium voratum]|uniref:Uncharacterized protein n=1 Tax=Effrenium voratum TaxID=2562239 RepID=A0AA36HXD5_9DINO|nr:unnamed protein product [Effrenium voratum]